MKVERVHFRLENASSSASSAIRALDVAKVLFMLVSPGIRTRLRAERSWQRTRAGTPGRLGRTGRRPWKCQMSQRTLSF